MLSVRLTIVRKSNSKIEHMKGHPILKDKKGVMKPLTFLVQI